MRNLLSIKSILTIWAWAKTASLANANTDIAFNQHKSPSGYLFGMMMPQKPTTDFIAQIVSPLTNGAGWGGVSLGGSMVGPLLLVTW